MRDKLCQKHEDRGAMLENVQCVDILAAVSSRCAGLGDAVSLPILIWSQQSAPSTHTYTLLTTTDR